MWSWKWEEHEESENSKKLLLKAMCGSKKEVQWKTGNLPFLKPHLLKKWN